MHSRIIFYNLTRKDGDIMRHYLRKLREISNMSIKKASEKLQISTERYEIMEGNIGYPLDRTEQLLICSVFNVPIHHVMEQEKTIKEIIRLNRERTVIQ